MPPATVLQAVGPTGRVIAFEPISDVHQACQLNLQPFDTAKALHCGVSDAAGSATFTKYSRCAAALDCCRRHRACLACLQARLNSSAAHATCAVPELRC
jgi:FkbM family methyltransferase